MLTKMLYDPAGIPEGIVTLNDVLLPVPVGARLLETLEFGGPVNSAVVFSELGGEPKLLPASVSNCPQFTLGGETEFKTGCGRGVGVTVGVAVAEAPHAVILNGRAADVPPLLVTIRL